MLIESLESRQLRSVSVQSLPGHGLYVRGTSAADNVIIAQSDRTAVVVDAVVVQDSPTSSHLDVDPKYSLTDPITGDPVVPTPIYNNIDYIIVDLGAGNDRIVYTGGAGAKAAISTGNGDDIAEVDTPTDNAQVVLDTGNGNDQVFIQAGGTSLVIGSAGNGNDSSSITVSDNARVIYSAGSGNDEAFLINIGSAANQLTYDGGSGFDTATFLQGSAITTHVEEPIIL